MADVIIRACGDYVAPVEGEALPDVRGLAKETLGKQVRRVGRFILLGLVGAARCVGANAPPAHTAIYLSSRRGDLETNVEVMEDLFARGLAPKPLSFINTVSNASCYYVARHFGLHGRSLFVSGVCFSFEAALQAALMDFETGQVRSALVGGLDTLIEPLAIERKRLGLTPDAPLAEASHWLWLERGNASAGDLVLKASEAFTDRGALIAWLRAQADGKTVLAQGQYLQESDLAAIAAETGLSRSFRYRDGRPYYDGQAAAALSTFAASDLDGAALAHINADPDGRFAAFLARKV